MPSGSNFMSEANKVKGQLLCNDESFNRLIVELQKCLYSI